MKVANVTGADDMTVKEASQLYVDTIEKKMKNGDDVRVSDIVNLADSL